MVKTNQAESIKIRLLNQARAKGIEFQTYLTRYACERLLYRLGTSGYGEKFILKGASLLGLWLNEPYRATKDVDFLALGPDSAEFVRDMVTAVLRQEYPEDALRFDPESVRFQPIRAQHKYHGQRVTMRAYLGKAVIALQLDIGFGDSVIPEPQITEFPTLLQEMAGPRLKSYSKVAAIAEKFHALVTLGKQNTRMKDFHDLWALADHFSFDGPELQTACQACFSRRGTIFSGEIPEALRPAYFRDPSAREYWWRYLQKSEFTKSPPDDFSETGEAIIRFLEPLYRALAENTKFEALWSPRGPWK